MSRMLGWLRNLWPRIVPTQLPSYVTPPHVQGGWCGSTKSVEDMRTQRKMKFEGMMRRERARAYAKAHAVSEHMVECARLIGERTSSRSRHGEGPSGASVRLPLAAPRVGYLPLAPSWTHTCWLYQALQPQIGVDG